MRKVAHRIHTESCMPPRPRSSIAEQCSPKVIIVAAIDDALAIVQVPGSAAVRIHHTKLSAGDCGYVNISS